MFKKIWTISIFLVLFLPVWVLADAPPPPQTIQNPITANSFTELIVNIINWVLNVVGFVALLMVVIGGFQYTVSAGNEEKIKEAIKTIKYSLIGLMIIALAGVFVRVVLDWLK